VPFWFVLARVRVFDYIHEAVLLRGASWKQINMVKTKGRTGLGVETLDSLVINTLNMQRLHEMNIAAFIDRTRGIK
jgi:hypothetical protein